MRFTAGLLIFVFAIVGLGHPCAADDKPGPDPREEKNEVYPEAFRKRVTKAVDEGVEYLLERQLSDGSWEAKDTDHGQAQPAQGAPSEDEKLSNHRLGMTALMTLACLKGGVKARDPAIQAAFRHMASYPIDETAKTYDVAVLLMALHAKYSPKDFAEVTTDKYGKRKIKDPCKTEMTKKDRAWMKACVEFLVNHQESGHWRYPAGGTDLSNTQYALLGLWAAARCGFKIKTQVWKSSLEWLLSMQAPTGRRVKLYVNEVRGDYRVAWTENAFARGFTYLPKIPPVTGSMTTAGLASIAICQEELWDSRAFKPDLRKKTRRGIRDALAWMQDNFELDKNPGHPTGGWHYYYLYGMERAGVLARTRFMGKYDWYYDGATYLLEKQRSDGSWISEHQHLDTAFAVLFLKRSTQRTRNPVITPSHK